MVNKNKKRDILSFLIGVSIGCIISVPILIIFALILKVVK